MYIPKHFQLTDPELIAKIIHENSFATIVSSNTNPLYQDRNYFAHIQATHSPLILSEDRTKLFGHFARPNPQWKTAQDSEVMCIFTGPHCYISPSWYETDRSVPTWNYIAVHVYGKLRIQTNEESILETMKTLIKKFESSDSSYQWENLDQDYLKGMVKGVVGFEIEITGMEGKAKLSQNHKKEGVQSVIVNLEKSQFDMDSQIAEWMKQINNLSSDAAESLGQ